MKDVITPEHRASAQEIRELLASYKEVEDMVLLNTYVKGTSPLADRAIRLNNDINQFLRQQTADRSDFETTLSKMRSMIAPHPSSRAAASDYVTSRRDRR